MASSVGGNNPLGWIPQPSGSTTGASGIASHVSGFSSYLHAPPETNPPQLTVLPPNFAEQPAPVQERVREYERLAHAPPPAEPKKPPPGAFQVIPTTGMPLLPPFNGSSGSVPPPIETSADASPQLTDLQVPVYPYALYQPQNPPPIGVPHMQMPPNPVASQQASAQPNQNAWPFISTPPTYFPTQVIQQNPFGAGVNFQPHTVFGMPSVNFQPSPQSQQQSTSLGERMLDELRKSPTQSPLNEKTKSSLQTYNAIMGNPSVQPYPQTAPRIFQGTYQGIGPNFQPNSSNPYIPNQYVIYSPQVNTNQNAQTTSPQTSEPPKAAGFNPTPEPDPNNSSNPNSSYVPTYDDLYGYHPERLFGSGGTPPPSQAPTAETVTQQAQVPPEHLDTQAPPVIDAPPEEEPTTRIPREQWHYDLMSEDGNATPQYKQIPLPENSRFKLASNFKNLFRRSK